MEYENGMLPYSSALNGISIHVILIIFKFN